MRIRNLRGGIFCLLLSLPLLAAGTTYSVNPDESGDFPTIQAAIDDASVIDGDVIELGSGTFTGPGNRDISCSKALTVRSAAGHPESLAGGSPEPYVRDGAGNQVPLPPHLPVATLKLPQLIGFRQSEIRSLLSGR